MLITKEDQVARQITFNFSLDFLQASDLFDCIHSEIVKLYDMRVDCVASGEKEKKIWAEGRIKYLEGIKDTIVKGSTYLKRDT